MITPFLILLFAWNVERRRDELRRMADAARERAWKRLYGVGLLEEAAKLDAEALELWRACNPRPLYANRGDKNPNPLDFGPTAGRRPQDASSANDERFDAWGNGR